VLFSDRKENQHHRSSSWFVTGEGNFQWVQLEKCVYSRNGRHLCVDVLKWLNKDWDEIVVTSYSCPTVILAMAYLRIRGIPFWMEVDGGLIRQDSGLKYAFKRLLVSAPSRWLSSGKTATEYLVHYGAKREAVQEYPFSSLHETDILQQPVSAEEKQALKAQLGMSGKTMILTIGQFVPRKGFDILLQAAAQLTDDVEIHIVGGEPTQEYQDLCEKLGLTNICFDGFMKKDRLIRYYKAADLFVLPTREDIWGLVINEAMAYGLPVITTDRCVAGLDLVENGVNGYLVPVNDPDQLAEKIQRALSENLVEMGRCALEKIRPYSIENMARVHMRIFEK
jgi:glycosyltransferase involved in cell wall biosynthesis